MVGLAVAAGSQLIGGGGRTPAPSRPTALSTRTTHRRGAAAVRAASTTARTTVHRSSAPVVRMPAHPSTAWQVVSTIGGQPVAWLAQRAGATLMRFDQPALRLILHSGSLDGGVTGWRYGDQITASEIHHIVAGFNGGFKLTYTEVGFVAGGHVAVPLSPGLASIVTYTDGTTNIGTWHNGVPSARKTVYSVLQNQHLLVDRGVAAATVSSCITACWGATIQGLTTVARSGLGITAGGQLIWAGGEQLTPATLASALISGGAQRAVELDINPDWVDGYLFSHHPDGPVAEPVIPGQLGIAGQLLAPDSRDFFTIVAG